MKNTKKYKFVGDSSGWGWDSNPVKGVIYDEVTLGKMYGKNWIARGGVQLIINWNTAEFNSEDIYWEEVTDELINKLIDLGSLYDQMIISVSELLVDLDTNIKNCSDPERGIEVVIELHKKHSLLNKKIMES